jgi:hypoxanthine phosphoribosyltransferase
MIRRRIRELGRDVQSDLDGDEWTVVALLNGSVMFVADLLRELAGPVRIDFMGVSSYGSGTGSGELKLTRPLRLDVRGRSVLIVDDILDTGQTLASVTTQVREMGARRVRTCVLLDKPSRRAVRFEADHVGFRIPDWFVVGYGLDYAERYRNLPFIGVLRPEVVTSSSPGETA